MVSRFLASLRSVSQHFDELVEEVEREQLVNLERPHRPVFWKSAAEYHPEIDPVNFALDTVLIQVLSPGVVNEMGDREYQWFLVKKAGSAGVASCFMNLVRVEFPLRVPLSDLPIHVEQEAIIQWVSPGEDTCRVLAVGDTIETQLVRTGKEH